MIKTQVKEGFVSFHGYNTWYRIAGENKETVKTPLLCLHGGPGATHDYLASLAGLTSAGRQVIFYDQLGWGNSDHPHHPSMWTVDLFIEELDTVRRALGFERVHILGHSWGGMLAMEYALRQPKGLTSLVLADTAASSPQWISETSRLVSELPPEVQKAIRIHEAQGTTDSPEYQEACRVFSNRHAGGHIDPKSERVRRAIEKLTDNDVYDTMWGPSEFCATGTLKDWDITDRLGEIHVSTLVICGRFDEATPILAETIRQGIPDAELVIFEKSAHFPHIEETKRYLQVLGQFLERVDAYL